MVKPVGRIVPFTLSYHFFGPASPQNHFDLFIDTGLEKLVHYRSDTKKGKQLQMKLGFAHDKKYLAYQGATSRGRVRILRRGEIETRLFAGQAGPVETFCFSL